MERINWGDAPYGNTAICQRLSIASQFAISLALSAKKTGQIADVMAKPEWHTSGLSYLFQWHNKNNTKDFQCTDRTH